MILAGAITEGHAAKYGDPTDPDVMAHEIGKCYDRIIDGKQTLFFIPR